MNKVYRDEFWKLQQIDISDDEDIFEKILEARKGVFGEGIDERFFLDFIPQESLMKYNFFAYQSSIQKFRDNCAVIGEEPLLKMGGYNMNPNHLNDDIRLAGIKMSDPYGKILGTFDIRNKAITYSPIWPHFYEERDLMKFANDRYFTVMTFEQIMEQQIEKAISFYVHTGNYGRIKDIIKNGRYILEKITKDEMLEYVHNPQKGIDTLKRVRNKY